MSRITLTYVARITFACIDAGAGVGLIVTPFMADLGVLSAAGGALVALLGALMLVNAAALFARECP